MKAKKEHTYHQECDEGEERLLSLSHWGLRIVMGSKNIQECSREEALCYFYFIIIQGGSSFLHHSLFLIFYVFKGGGCDVWFLNCFDLLLLELRVHRRHALYLQR